MRTGRCFAGAGAEPLLGAAQRTALTHARAWRLHLSRYTVPDCAVPSTCLRTRASPFDRPCPKPVGTCPGTECAFLHIPRLRCVLGDLHLPFCPQAETCSSARPCVRCSCSRRLLRQRAPWRRRKPRGSRRRKPRQGPAQVLLGRRRGRPCSTCCRRRRLRRARAASAADTSSAKTSPTAARHSWPLRSRRRLPPPLWAAARVRCSLMLCRSCHLLAGQRCLHNTFIQFRQLIVLAELWHRQPANSGLSPHDR